MPRIVLLYCPLQRINQRNESQKQRLEEKRCQVRKQYAGAIEVADFARSLNVQVHRELAERCEAWKLAEIEEFLLRHALKKITCRGCAVGLKTLDGKQALCKGWTIATTNAELQQHLDLRCQRNHQKGRCEGGQTAHTARYTQPFARKVIDSLSACETWSRIVNLLNKEVEAALPAEEPEDADMLEEDVKMEDVAMLPENEEERREREEIEKKIAHIHRSTGHGNMENLVQALQHRGAGEKVLQIARNWKCSTCQRYQRRDPRRFATLEPIPQKWERIQVDVATWMHPQTKAKYHVLLVVDEGSRFQIAKVISSGEGNQATWEDMKKVLEENWFSIFGVPKVMKVDPAGPWMSQAATDSAEENRKGVEIEWELPSSRRGIKKFINNPEAYVCTQLKRKQVEVREKQLTPSEALEFHKAKETELKNFIASGCFELAKDVVPDEHRIVGMRWLLTWKHGESYEGGKKAKARGIILGYQDPEYENRKTSAPTPSRSGRQLFWQLCSWKRFRLKKGDISGAFLQGDDMEEELWCRPVKEITDALGLPEHTPMLMRKAAYGLVQAPLQWFYAINNFLGNLG